MSERDIATVLNYHRDKLGGGYELINPDGPEAAAEILRLRAKLAEAMAALSRANDAGERAAAAVEMLIKKLEEARDAALEEAAIAMIELGAMQIGCHGTNLAATIRALKGQKP